MVSGVKGRSSDRRHGTATFGVGTHGHQHAPHIGVVNDGCSGLDGAVHWAGLHTVTGVLRGFLVGTVGDRYALHTHRVTSGVHHDEHVLQATVFLPHQVADCATVIAVLQHRCGAGFDAHFVLDAHAMHIVACTQGAVFVHHHFGHHKQADALDTFGCATDTGQHQMDDVVGHVVLAVGDVNLGTEHLVSAIGLGLGTRAHHGQIRTRLGFSEVHGAGPLAADQFVKVSGFEFIAARCQQGFDSAVRQQGAQRKTHVGGIEHFNASRAYGFRQTLTAKLGGVLQTLPAAFGVLLVSLFETCGGGDHAVFPS